MTTEQRIRGKKGRMRRKEEVRKREGERGEKVREEGKSRDPEVSRVRTRRLES